VPTSKERGTGGWSGGGKGRGREEERKEWEGRRAEGEYAPLALGRMDAPVQKHRLIARKIIFIAPPCTPGSQKWGGQFSSYTPVPPGPKSGGTMSPHAPRLRRPCQHQVVNFDEVYCI